MAKRISRSFRGRQKSSPGSIPGWQKQLVAYFVLVMAILVAVDWLYVKPRTGLGRRNDRHASLKALSADERVRLAIDRVLLDHGIRLAWISERNNQRLIRTPREVQPLELYQHLANAIQTQGGSVVSGNENLRTGEMTLTYKATHTGLLLLKPDAALSSKAGRLAVIIDDFGYQDSPVVASFAELPFAITYSIIPGLTHSAAIAERLANSGKPVMIHMPMQALERRVENHGFELMVDMRPEEIRARVRKAIAALPHAAGMNNHMGSRATVDDALLTAALSELKQAGLYFVDSKTNSQTKAFALAREMGVPAALNDTFLDNDEEVGAISAKLFHLADVAAENGSAIGIGHVHAATLAALQQTVPILEKRGFEFVAIKDLLIGAGTTASPIVARGN